MRRVLRSRLRGGGGPHLLLLHVTAAGQDIVAIVDSSHHVKPGDDLKLHLPLSKLHLFDAESGASLVSARAAAAVA